jgi:hypothetical protein
VNDKKLFKWLALLVILPVALAIFGGDQFRYPCHDPKNWDAPQCQKPLCDVTRTCPEHIFKGQRDPRLGPPPEGNAPVAAPGPAMPRAPQGVECK